MRERNGKTIEKGEGNCKGNEKHENGKIRQWKDMTKRKRTKHKKVKKIVLKKKTTTKNMNMKRKLQEMRTEKITLKRHVVRKKQKWNTWEWTENSQDILKETQRILNKCKCAEKWKRNLKNKIEGRRGRGRKTKTNAKRKEKKRTKKRGKGKHGRKKMNRTNFQNNATQKKAVQKMSSTHAPKTYFSCLENVKKNPLSFTVFGTI